MLYVQTKMFPWHMALLRREIMALALVPAVFTLTYFETWAAVYAPEGK